MSTVVLCLWFYLHLCNQFLEVKMSQICETDYQIILDVLIWKNLTNFLMSGKIKYGVNGTIG